MHWYDFHNINIIMKNISNILVWQPPRLQCEDNIYHCQLHWGDRHGGWYWPVRWTILDSDWPGRASRGRALCSDWPLISRGWGGHWLPLGVGAAVRLSGHTNTVTTPLSALLCSALYSLLSPHFNSLIWNNNSRFKGEAFNSLFWNGFIFYYFPLFIPGTTFK